MVVLTAIKSIDNVVKGESYLLGGVYQGTGKLALMTRNPKNIVRGTYDSKEVFGLSKKEVMRKIKED